MIKAIHSVLALTSLTVSLQSLDNYVVLLYDKTRRIEFLVLVIPNVSLLLELT